MSDDQDTTPTPQIAERQAEVTLSREQLAATVDALADRLDPRKQADRAAARGKRLVFDATDAAALPEDKARARKILGVAGAAVGLVVFGIVRKIGR